MAPPAVDYYCRKFQPNTFDPSRCSCCLRPEHMHLSTSTTADALQQDCQEWVCMSIIWPYSKNNTTIIILSCLVRKYCVMDISYCQKIYSLCPWVHKKHRFVFWFVHLGSLIMITLVWLLVSLLNKFMSVFQFCKTFLIRQILEIQVHQEQDLL